MPSLKQNLSYVVSTRSVLALRVIVSVCVCMCGLAVTTENRVCFILSLNVGMFAGGFRLGTRRSCRARGRCERDTECKTNIYMGSRNTRPNVWSVNLIKRFKCLGL